MRRLPYPAWLSAAMDHPPLIGPAIAREVKKASVEMFFKGSGPKRRELETLFLRALRNGDREIVRHLMEGGLTRECPNASAVNPSAAKEMAHDALIDATCYAPPAMQELALSLFEPRREDVELYFIKVRQLHVPTLRRFLAIASAEDLGCMGAELTAVRALGRQETLEYAKLMYAAGSRRFTIPLLSLFGELAVAWDSTTPETEYVVRKELMRRRQLIAEAGIRLEDAPEIWIQAANGWEKHPLFLGTAPAAVQC